MQRCIHCYGKLMFLCQQLKLITVTFNHANLGGCGCVGYINIFIHGNLMCLIYNMQRCIHCYDNLLFFCQQLKLITVICNHANLAGRGCVGYINIFIHGNPMCLIYIIQRCIHCYGKLMFLCHI